MINSISGTITISAAASETWPVVVIGAGPAGALAARELARQNVRVLLIDKASFPRPKVCGGCLGAAALNVLASCGLGDLPQQFGALPLHTLQIEVRGSSARLPLAGGASITRETFDAALIREAIVAGAHFLPETTVRLDQLIDQHRTLQVKHGSQTETIAAAVVIAADGLAGSLLASQDEMKSQVATGSRIGLGCTILSDDAAYQPGIVTMAYGGGGYVGLVRVEQGRLNIAAAFAANYVRACGDPASAVQDLLRDIGLPVPTRLHEAHWMGTPPLTRNRQQVAAERLLIIGDAAGYIEPFTGEGMTWAMLAGRGVVPFAIAAANAWSPTIAQRWKQQFRELVQRRQWVCKTIASLSRFPWASRVAVRTLASFPWLASPMLNAVSRIG